MLQMPALFRIGKGLPPPIPDSLSKDARHFVSQCLKVDPNNRATAAQLLDHPFVKRPLSTSSGSASPFLVRQHWKIESWRGIYHFCFFSTVLCLSSRWQWKLKKPQLMWILACFLGGAQKPEGVVHIFSLCKIDIWCNCDDDKCVTFMN